MAKQNNYIVCLDWETGGLDPTKHAVTQIGMEILDPITLKSIKKYSNYVKPYIKKEKKKSRVKKLVEREGRAEYYEYQDKALQYTNITVEMCEDKGIEIEELVKDIIDMFKAANPTNARNYKPVLLGQNLGFDIGFLQQVFEHCGEKLEKYVTTYKDFHGNAQPVYFDTQYLSRVYFAEDDRMTSVKLNLVSDELGVELVSHHSADADVEATSGIFEIYVKNMRSSGGDSKKKTEKTRNHFKF